jgi:hypothetical protein
MQCVGISWDNRFATQGQFEQKYGLLFTVVDDHCSGVMILLFSKIPPIYQKSSTAVQTAQKIIKITNRYLDHLATTTYTSASRMHATILALHHWSRAKLVVVEPVVVDRRVVLRPQRIIARATTIANNGNCRSGETNLKPHE